MEMDTLHKEICGNNFKVGSWLWVDVMHIINPQYFYVRPRTYRKYLPKLQSKGERIDASKINVGDVFVFQSEFLQCTVRGKIVLCEKVGDEPTYKMFAIDNGFTEQRVPLNRIWTTTYSPEVPPLATRCQLACCDPLDNTWDSDAIDAMRIFVEGERAKIVIKRKTSDSIVVDMYNSNHDDIATLMAYCNCSTFGYVSGSSRRNVPEVKTCTYAVKDLAVGNVIHVRKQSGILLEQFYVTAIEDYKQYLSDRNDYTSYARSQKEVFMNELKINAPIGVLYHKNNKFERGLVKELLPESDRAKVELVDWGIVIEESVMKMKHLPDWYLRVPIRAYLCSVHSSQSYFNGFATLTNLGAEFKITVKEVGNRDLMCPNIVTISPLKM